MTTEIKRGTARTVWIEPPSRWTGSISVVVESSEGVELETPTGTPDAVNTTVVADPSNTPTTVKVASLTGVAVGRLLAVTSDAWTARAKVAAVDDDDTTVTFLEPLPGVPEHGDAVQGVQVGVPLTTATTSTAALFHRIVATSGAEETVETVHVVEHPWVFPYSVREIRDVVATNWPSHPRAADEAWLSGVREEADEDLRDRLISAHRYAHRVFDSRALRRAALHAVNLALASRQLIPRGRDADAWVTSERFELRDRVAGLLKSPQPYDTDGNGKVSPTELVGGTCVIELTR